MRDIWLKRRFLGFARNDRRKRGFTLVELMVSVSITALLMLGMSTFFSGTFRSVFEIQEKTSAQQGQFMLNEILRDKFETLSSVMSFSPTEVFLRNETDNGQMPFTYIGGYNGHLVFKDLFVFNDVEISGGDVYYGDYENGQIITGGVPVVSGLPANFGGFAKYGSYFYVAIPDRNEVWDCDLSNCHAIDFGNITLSRPTDVAINPANGNLYISDSGNDWIIKYASNIASVVARDLNFPTGLAFYDGHNSLFVSNTYDNEVISVNLTDSSKTVVAGAGDNENCDNSAKYCELNFPTGLALSGDSLFVADTGNNRILKITDPETDLSNVSIDFDLTSPTKISKVEVIFPDVPTLVSSSTTLHDDLGKKELVADTYTFSLAVPIVSGDKGGDPSCEDAVLDPVVFFFCRFIVPDSANIFNPAGGDDILLNDTDSYSVDHLDLFPTDFGDSFDAVWVTPDDTQTSYSANTTVSINNDFNGIQTFDFDLTGSSFGSFSNFHLDVYNTADTIVTSTDKIVRIGDGVLGTEEDLAEVFMDSGLSYPTGLAAIGNTLFVADSLNDKLKSSPIDSPALSDVVLILPYSTALTDFDYTSDFEIADIQFEKYNADKLLQLTVNAKVDSTTTETYTLDAKVTNP